MLKIETQVLSANVKGNAVELKIEDLHQEGLNKILAYGFQRFINDACGGDKTEEEVKGIIEKRLEMLKTGQVGRSNSGRKATNNQVKAERIVLERYFLKYDVMKKGEIKKWLAQNDYDNAMAHLFNKIAEKVLKKTLTQFHPDDLVKVAQMKGKNEPKLLAEIAEEKAKLDSVAEVEIEIDLEEVEI